MNESGFIARGPLAIIILSVLGGLLLIDTLTGKATTQDYETFGGILVLSAVITIAVALFRKKPPASGE